MKFTLNKTVFFLDYSVGQSGYDFNKKNTKDLDNKLFIKLGGLILTFMHTYTFSLFK